VKVVPVGRKQEPRTISSLACAAAIVLAGLWLTAGPAHAAGTHAAENKAQTKTQTKTQDADESQILAAMARKVSIEEIRGMLKDAHGIGLVTKLWLEHQVNRFTEDFYWFHKRAGRATLAQMRDRFKALHGRIVSLLKETNNPQLAERFDEAGPALWYAYRDPTIFSHTVGKNVVARIESTPVAFGDTDFR
jgi:hypothetical protein